MTGKLTPVSRLHLSVLSDPYLSLVLHDRLFPRVNLMPILLNYEITHSNACHRLDWVSTIVSYESSPMGLFVSDGHDTEDSPHADRLSPAAPYQI